MIPAHRPMTGELPAIHSPYTHNHYLVDRVWNHAGTMATFLALNQTPRNLVDYTELDDRLQAMQAPESIWPASSPAINNFCELRLIPDGLLEAGHTTSKHGNSVIGVRLAPPGKTIGLPAACAFLPAITKRVSLSVLFSPYRHTDPEHPPRRVLLYTHLLQRFNKPTVLSNIAEITDYSPGSAYTFVQNLSQAGVLTTEKVRRKVYAWIAPGLRTPIHDLLIKRHLIATDKDYRDSALEIADQLTEHPISMARMLKDISR